MDIKVYKEAAEYIQSKLDYKPEIGVILGSGLGSITEEVENPIYIKYSEIPNFPVSTVVGHAGQFVCGKINGKNVIMMQGRFHFYEGYNMKEVTMPVRVLKLLGVDKLIVTNACGGANISFKPGDLMIIKDIINLSGSNPLMGKNIEEFGTRFPDMSQPFSKELIEVAFNAGKDNDISLVQGVYAMFTGPMYETPAEVRMARIIGADAVGMSTVPEVIAANHCGIKVLGISCITNMAAGILDQPLSHEEVIETSSRVKNKFITLVKEIIKGIN